MKSRYDVIIIGGGLAGSALAAVLGRAGVDVVVFERDTFPREKLCGEFLSPESLELLVRVGCLEDVLAASPARVARARFTAPSGRALDVDLPGSGIGLSRRRLDAILFRHAGRSGAHTFEAADVERMETTGESRFPATVRVCLGGSQRSGRRCIRTVSAPWIIGAYGRRSKIDRKLGRAFLNQSHPYVGLKRHHKLSSRHSNRVCPELDGTVEIHSFDGGYCGVSVVEDQRVNVCALLTKRFLKSLPSTSWEDATQAMSAANAILASRLSCLEPAEPDTHAVAGIPFCVKDLARAPFLFAGDAAGMIAPLCGDGQAMALRSALLLADLITTEKAPRADEDFERLKHIWHRAWRREFGVRMALGRVLQPILLRRAGAEVALLLGRCVPLLPAILVRATRGRPTPLESETLTPVGDQSGLSGWQRSVRGNGESTR